MLRFLIVAIVAVGLNACATAGARAVDEPDAVRDTLRTLLSSASLPDPAPVDPELLAENVEGFWSDGRTHRGRDAFVAAYETAVAELEAEFETFSIEPTDVTLALSGDMACLSCRLELGGVLTGERGEYHRTVRSTFVFHKQDGRWQLVHEHSSRLPPGGG
jgi:ketosteroid isomerase-like protein